MRIARGFDRDLGSRPGSAQPQVTREWLVDASDGSQLAEPAGLGFLGIGYPTILNGSERPDRYDRRESQQA